MSFISHLGKILGAGPKSPTGGLLGCSGAVDEAAVKQVGDELRALKEKLKQEARDISEQVGSWSFTCWVLCQKNDLGVPQKTAGSLL